MIQLYLKGLKYPALIKSKLLFLMLLTLFISLPYMMLATSLYAQNTKMSFEVKSSTVKTVLKMIEEKSEFRFFYNSDLADLDKVIDGSFTDKTIDEILRLVFMDTSVGYRILDNNFVVLSSAEVLQQIQISGTVMDESDDPLPGVTVTIKGLSQGTATDANGAYSLTVPNANVTLVFSYIGYATLEYPVGNQRTINVVLQEASTVLDEVVVTALGIRREVKALGYAAQEIGAADLGAARESKLTNYLTGKIAGVQIANTAGGVGGSTVITIRGNKTFQGSSQPLFVVDGMPIINMSNSSPNAGLNNDRDFGDGVFDINPEDVETMTVLKGPNATALYGSRGANGVVLITTKSGRKKGIGVEVNSNVSFDFVNMIPKFQNKYGPGYDDDIFDWYGKKTINGIEAYEPDWGNLDSWGGPLDGSYYIVDYFKMPGEEPGVMKHLPQPASNVKDFFDVGISTTNNIAVTGGNEISNARFSAGHSTMKGVIPNHEVKRTNLAISASTRPKKWISFDGRVSYSRTVGNQRPIIGYDDQSPVWNLLIMARYTPTDFLKEYYKNTKSFARFPGENYNPWYIVNELVNNDTRDRFMGHLSGTIHFTDWLTLMGRVGGDIYTEIRDERWRFGAKNTGYNQGRQQQSTRHHRDMNADAILSANKPVSSDFTLSGSVGASIVKQTRERMSWTAQGFKIIDIFDITNYNTVVPNYNLWEKEMQSVFFMAQVAYKNYLFLDVTGRNDWSSTLGLTNNSYFYPSVGTSFVFTDAIDINKNILSFGKIRLSWAQVGNDADPYQTMFGYGIDAIQINGQSMASKNERIPLWNLKNELAESWEIGTDLRFFKHRLGIDITYYDGKTTNQIMNTSVSQASGYTGVVINAGEVRNNGVEISLNANPIALPNSFRWDVRINMAKNNSKVVKLAPGIQSYTLINIGGSVTNSIEARVGERFGNIVGYAYQKAPDGQRIVNSAGQYVRESTTSILGNITPDWVGGVNNSFTYKGLSLNVLFDYVIGGQLISHTKERMTAKGTGKWTEEGRRPVIADAAGNQLPYVGVLPGVIEIKDAEGNVTGYAPNERPVSGQAYWAQRAWGNIGEEFIMDAGFLMLREVMLGYTFQPSLLSKTPITSLQLSFVGRNLGYLLHGMGQVGVSPESQPSTAVGASGIEAIAMPTTRTFGMNLKLTF